MGKTFTVLVLILVVVLGILWVTQSQNQQPSSNVATTTPTTATVTTTKTPSTKTPITGGSTYKSLLTQQGNYECDYDQVTNSGQSHNVIYLSNGKMRAEFHPVSGTGSYAVYDGHYLYTWTEGKSVGVRTVVTSLGQLPAAVPQNLLSGQIYGDTYNSVGWICHRWLVNASLLVPPSYVKF